MNSGNVYVTSRKQNYIPDESFFIYSNELPEVSLSESSISINDASGNGNGILNPGETALISMEIENISDFSIDGSIIASLYSESEYITLSNNENINLGSFSGNVSSLDINNISITASNTISDIDDPMLRLTVYSNSDDLLWNYIVPINFSSANLEFSYDVNTQLNVGGTSDITLIIDNNGSMGLSNVTAEVSIGNDLLEFDSNLFSFNYIGPNQNSYSDNSISLSVSDDLINGSVLPVSLSISSDSG